jgi:hypothetical protein
MSDEEKRRKLNLMREDRKAGASRPTPPVLKTKKATELKTSAGMNKEIMNREIPKGQGRTEVKPYFNQLIDKAMSRSKKTDKVGMGGRSVSKEKGLSTRTVDGKDQIVREKTKVVKRASGTVKKTVTKGKGVEGSVIGRYKDVKRFK